MIGLRIVETLKRHNLRHDRLGKYLGRIQLRYSAGMWNEWYLLFDDGSASWLGDSSGMFVVTSLVNFPGRLPAFVHGQPIAALREHRPQRILQRRAAIDGVA